MTFRTNRLLDRVKQEQRQEEETNVGEKNLIIRHQIATTDGFLMCPLTYGV